MRLDWKISLAWLFTPRVLSYFAKLGALGAGMGLIIFLVRLAKGLSSWSFAWVILFCAAVVGGGMFLAEFIGDLIVPQRVIADDRGITYFSLHNRIGKEIRTDWRDFEAFHIEKHPLFPFLRQVVLARRGYPLPFELPLPKDKVVAEQFLAMLRNILPERSGTEL